MSQKLTNREIDKLIETRLLNNPNIYDLRCEFQVIEQRISLEAAKAIIDFYPANEQLRYSITTIKDLPKYSEDLDLAVRVVVGEILQRSMPNYTNTGFLVSYFPEEGWRATFGDVEDAVDAFDDKSPARAICLAALEYIKGA
jgi:hypothetical protein